ncbi:hypothetical protein GCM10009827_073860 [Dactylosporangium maewongense]|uniref:Uncharacterized protein n=1 Tax=Dactylosporangium maewongense TaxID=634393 RepID=A0ABN2BLH3_9ACTN
MLSGAGRSCRYAVAVQELRVFQVGDVRVELRELTLRDQYFGMIEGTPAMHRRFVVRRLEQELASTAGLHVHDLDRIRADAEARTDEWMPRERHQARLTSAWIPPDCRLGGHTELSVVWFQPPSEDPFDRLAAVVEPLDWRTLAVFHPFDPDNY